MENSTDQLSTSTIDQYLIVEGDTGDALIKKLEAYRQEAEPLYKNRLKWCQSNMDKYLNKYSTKERAKWRSNTTHNKQFENIETIIPTMTERLPEPIMAVPGDTPEALQAARLVTNALLDVHYKDDLQTKGEQIQRHMMVYRDAVVTVLWDTTIGKHGGISTEIIDPEYCRISPNSTYNRQGNYFFKEVPRDYRWAMQQFSEKKDVIKRSFGVEQNKTNDSEDEQQKVLDTLLPIIEAWYWRQDNDGKFRIYTTSYINTENGELNTKRSPLWDDEGYLPFEADQQLEQELKQANDGALITTGQPLSEDDVKNIVAKYDDLRLFRNFLETEELPYIIFPSYIDTKTPFSITSNVEQTASLQDSYNKRLQQIDENANKMANGYWLVDNDSGVNIKKITNAPGLIIPKNPNTVVEQKPGVPLPSYVVQDAQNSAANIDNIWGARNIIKGENPGANVPARTSILLEKAARGRVAGMIRHYEKSMEKVYAWHIQLMKMFYKEDRMFAVTDNKGKIQSFQEISQDKIDDNLQMRVKIGSALPIDHESRRLDMFEMYSKGQIDPLTFFEYTGDFPDPEETARRLDKWKKGILFEEPAPSIEEITRKELEDILNGKRVTPNRQATLGSVQIEQEAFTNIAQWPFTPEQRKVLEQKIQIELQMIEAQRQQKEAERQQASMQSMTPGSTPPMDEQPPLPQQLTQ